MWAVLMLISHTDKFYQGDKFSKLSPLYSLDELTAVAVVILNGLNDSLTRLAELPVLPSRMSLHWPATLVQCLEVANSIVTFLFEANRVTGIHVARLVLLKMVRNICQMFPAACAKVTRFCAAGPLRSSEPEISHFICGMWRLLVIRPRPLL
jgi:hypothetical protein